MENEKGLVPDPEDHLLLDLEEEDQKEDDDHGETGVYIVHFNHFFAPPPSLRNLFFPHNSRSRQLGRIPDRLPRKFLNF